MLLEELDLTPKGQAAQTQLRKGGKGGVGGVGGVG